MQRWTDEQVEQAVGNVLRTGVIVAAAVTVIGGAAYLARHGHDIVTYGVFRGPVDGLTSVGGIVRHALTGQTSAIIQLGLLVLIATPVARVALSLIGFIRQADRTYMAITAVVLAILAFSLAGGRL
ncbi:MAG TPA: DUF1634 domain-containing protein [Gemmatimonadales bacterium]|jgi:uncharacterized membrane protein